MMIMKSRYIVTFLLLMLSAVVNAQQVQVGINFTAASDSEDYFDVPVQSGNVWHAIDEVNTNLSVSFTESNYNLVEYTMVLKRGTTTQKTWSKQTSPNIPAYTLTNDGEYSIELQNVVYTRTQNETTVRDTLYKDTAFSAAKFSVKLYDAPEVRSENVSTLSSEVIWDNTQRSFAVTTRDGYDNGWRYEWLFDDNTIGTNSSWTGILSETNGASAFKLVVTNMAPDGQTVWFRNEYVRNFTVYEFPSASLTTSSDNYSSLMNWYCSDSNVPSLAVNTDGGSSNWSYKWQNNGKVVSSSSVFKPTMDENSSNFGVSDTYNYNYTLVVTNTPAGMQQELIDEATITLNGTIRFWKTPTVEFNNDGYESVFEGNDIIMQPVITSGNPAGWTFRCDDATIQSYDTESGDRMYYFTAADVDAESVDVSYSIHYTNTLEGGYSSVSGYTNVYAKVYNTPTVDLFYNSNNPAIKTKECRPANNKIYLNSGFGGNATIFVKTLYGDDSAWSYSWLDETDGTIQSTTDQLGVYASEIGTINYTLTLVNSPAGVIEPFTKTLNIQVNVLQQPSYTVLNGSDVYAQIAGKSVSPSFGINGGYSNGWEYVWYDEDGYEVSRDLSATILVPDNITSKTTINYDVNVSNIGPEGDIWFDGSAPENKKRIRINAYPSPYKVGNPYFVGFDSNRKDVYYETEHEVSFNEGTYNQIVPEAEWTYNIYYRDDEAPSFSRTNSYILKISKPTGVEHTLTPVRMQVNCNIYDSETGTDLIAYNEYRDLDLHSWTTGTVQQLSYTKHLQFGATTNLNSSVTGGYENGWYFEWRDSQHIPINVDKNHYYQYTNNYETGAPRNTTYYLYCENKIGSVVGYSNEFAYTFKEYSKPVSAEIYGNYDELLRHGDEYTIQVKVPSGANVDGWQYMWADESEWIPLNGQDVLQYTYTARTTSGNEPYAQDKVITFYYRNISPENSSVWSSGQVNFRVKVHRRPHEPNLVRKGNGTSKIYIAQVSGATREGESGYKNYQFEFGYYNNGVYAVSGTVKDMHYKYSSNPKNPYVRSLWTYKYGSETFYCYSDYVMYGSALKAELMDLTLENGRFRAVLEEEMPAKLIVYSTDGKVVIQKDYPAQAEYNEEIDFEGLKSGIYLVRCVIGDQQVVKKIMVQQ